MPALTDAVRHLMGLSLLRSSMVFALSGAAFALGMLLLARVMPVEAFGELSLLLALFNIFCLLAPAGIDQIAVRHGLVPDVRLMGIVLISGAALGAIVTFATMVTGGASTWEAIAVGLSIWVGGLVVTASGFLRSSGSFALAMWIFTGGNWGLLLIGVAGQWIAMSKAGLPFTLFLIGQALIAIGAWLHLFKREKSSDGASAPVDWREATALIGMAAVGTIVLQIERVLIPPLVGLSALATFSVLASVAIFPFRIVTAGLEFSLTPRLRAETDPYRRRVLLLRELGLIAAVLIAATIVVLGLAPRIANWITGDRYPLPVPLLLAACLNGAVKFVQTVPRAVLTACGSGRDLTFLNMTGWTGLVLGAAGGVIGSGNGLTGIVLGVAIGTLIGNLPAFLSLRTILHEPVK